LSGSPLARQRHRTLEAARGQAFWSRPDFIYGLFALNAGLICGFWWFSSGFEFTHSLSDAFNGLGRVTGLVGTYLVLCQLLLMARSRWLESGLGFERMAVLHKWNGYVAVSLLIAHGVFQTLGYQLGDGKDVASQLGDLVAHYPGLVGAIVALGLFIAVAAVSVVIARRHIAYETWYYVHLYTYIAVALAFTHQVATGVDFAGNPLFVAYWYLLYASTAGLLVLHRVVEPLLSYQRHRFHVQSVQKEGRGVFSIYIAGRNLNDFRAQAGQFAIWRFVDRSRWWQAHPFSISAVPDGRRLRITVKNIGDFTGGIHGVRAGTPVLVEGPFGKFTERPAGRHVVLIAGGIGITPIRALVEEMAADGFDARVLYRAHGPGDLVFKNELEALRDTLGVRIDYLLTEEGGRKRSHDSWFGVTELIRLVPDIKERVVYICGPTAMAASLHASLRTIGVPPDHVRTEAFRLL
jgi:predicted ferric reductase